MMKDCVNLTVKNSSKHKRAKAVKAVLDLFWCALYFALGAYATATLMPHLWQPKPTTTFPQVRHVQQDMNTLGAIYAEHGSALNQNNPPFVLSLPEIFSRIGETVPEKSWGSSLQKGKPWFGSEIFLIGQQERLMVALISEQDCTRMAKQAGMPVKEMDGLARGLSYMVNKAKVKYPTCYRQRWSGSANTLFSSLYFGKLPDGMVGHLMFQRVKSIPFTPSKQPEPVRKKPPLSQI